MSRSNEEARRETDVVGTVVDGLLRVLWRCRVELVLVAVPAVAYLALTSVLPPVVAGWLVVVALVLLITAPRARRRLWALLVRAHWRRRVERALAQLATRCFGGTAPRVKGVVRSSYGVHLDIRLRTGHAPTHIEGAREHLGAALRVREVRVRPEPDDKSVMHVTLVRRDALSGAPIPTPLAEVTRADVWRPIPIGLDEAGRVVSLGLVGRNVLIGGAPGFGKSNLLQQLAGSAALDPAASLFCLDPKLVELRRYAPVAAGFAGPDLDEAIVVLRALDAEMTRRYHYLDEQGMRGVTRYDGFPLQVLVADEIGMYLTNGDKKKITEFETLLHGLVARGRAGGVICVLALQKPSADVIPTSIRDNLAYRVAFRTTTRDASDTILGAGSATDGYSSADLDAATPGVCWIVAEEAAPLKVRCYYLDDDALRSVVERARALRQ